MNNSEQIKIRVLMFPWLAHGHISPFLELSKKLAERNFHIYLCSSPVNLSSIKPKLPQKFSHSIQLVELHLPSLPELPPHHHTTNGLPLHLMSTLKKAFDMASPDFSNILKSLKPDLLVYDFLQPWAPKLASSLSIPAVLFLSTSAAMSAFSNHTVLKPNVGFPFQEIFLREYEVENFRQLLHSPANGVSDQQRVLECSESSENLVLIKTFKETEGEYIDYVSSLIQKKYVPVGPLVELGTETESQGDEILHWLSQKEKASTVYVSFGSEYFPTKEETIGIALGLELSNVNFIWAMRFPADEDVKFEEALPEGYIKRVGGRGMIVEGWVPQRKILADSSIGGFLSHCGWGSVMESIKLGVPIIAMPMHLDQPVNARVVGHVGFGVEVVRDECGKILEEEMGKVIREVVMEEAGNHVRKKAKELSEILRNKGDEEIEHVVEELVQLVMKSRSGNFAQKMNVANVSHVRGAY